MRSSTGIGERNVCRFGRIYPKCIAAEIRRQPVSKSKEMPATEGAADAFALPFEKAGVEWDVV